MLKTRLFQPVSVRMICFALLALSLAAGRAAADEPQSRPLWPRGLPDSLIRHGRPETIESRESGRFSSSGSNRIVSYVETPELTVFPAPEVQEAPAVVIFPGGGFRRLAIDKEGLEIARRLNEAGMTGVVVKYRLCPEQSQTADGKVPDSVRTAILADGPRAVRMVRTNAEAWGIDPECIGVIGFSAGGYMAAYTATHFDSGRPESSDPVERAGSRPDFAGLIYPAVPPGIDSLVTADTPPVFLVNADDDQTTPAVKAIALHGALRAAGVTTEMHIFTRGGHGFGLGVEGGAVTAWPGLFEAWLREQGVIGEQ